MRDNDFVFEPEALELFKKIVLSCTSREEILKMLRIFLSLSGSVSLSQTVEHIFTGSITIFNYKRNHGDSTITVEDILLAFSGHEHFEDMERMIEHKKDDLWVELFPREDYLLSHLVKPVKFIYRGGRCHDFRVAKYDKDDIDTNFWGIQEFDDIDIDQTQFIHFGLIVYQTSQLELVRKVTERQKKFFSNEPKNILYNNLKIRDVYRRNIEFYKSIKPT